MCVTEDSLIALVPPCASDYVLQKNEIVLVSNDGRTRFPVATKTMKFYSKFINDVLAGDNDGELPLDSEQSSPELVQKLSTWMKHHERIPVSKIAVPLPRLSRIDDFYTDPWDIEFLRQHFVGEDEDMSRCRQLYDFALLSVYLQVTPLTRMIATFFAWHIKKGLRDGMEPTQLMARWLGRSTAYSLSEVRNAAEWVREALRGLELPTERTLDSDDEFSKPPDSQ